MRALHSILSLSLAALSPTVAIAAVGTIATKPAIAATANTAATTPAPAESNFHPEHSLIHVETIGALNWLPNPRDGAVINQFYATGYLYGANIGWVHLGSGPADAFQYRNHSATDFGVNVTPTGELRGFAYGANIGWLHFEPLGNPRIDWTTGKLSGRVWAANLGWIDLQNPPHFLQLESLATPPDSDQDDLPDPWEIAHASNLTTFARGLDADADGQSDRDEYLAGTDPLDANDFLSLQLMLAADSAQPVLRWATRDSYLYFIDQRESLDPAVPWQPTASEPIIGTGENISLTLTPTSAAKFFRIRAYPPLSAPNL